jgi:phytoene dehydrogenase-like protein
VPTNTYDLIVLGDDLPGVITATLCASRGMRVLLATTRVDPESYEVGPYRLPTRPLSIVGLSSPAIARTMDELNFVHLLKRRLRQTSPAFQFIGPDARIDVTADDEGFASEVRRDFPADDAEAAIAHAQTARTISDLLDPLIGQPAEFPPTKFFERREIARAEDPLHTASAQIDGLGAEAPLASALLAAPAALSAHGDPRELTAIARGRAFDMWRRGVAQLPGGRAALRSIFLDKFSSHGGEVRAVSAESLVVSWGKVTGVRSHDGEELGASHVVVAMPVEQVLELVGRKPPKKLVELAQQVQPSAYRYTLNVVLAEAGVPQGIASTALVVADPSRPLIDDNAIALHIGEADDEGRTAVNIEAICASPGEEGPRQEHFAALRERLMARLEEVMPFSRDHILTAHSPYESRAPDGFAVPAELPKPAHPLPAWRSDRPPQLGLAAAPYHVGLKRLTLASPQILPGLGLEGEFAVGWSAARIACAGSKKRDLLKDEVISGTTARAR